MKFQCTHTLPCLLCIAFSACLSPSRSSFVFQIPFHSLIGRAQSFSEQITNRACRKGILTADRLRSSYGIYVNQCQPDPHTILLSTVLCVLRDSTFLSPILHSGRPSNSKKLCPGYSAPRAAAMRASHCVQPELCAHEVAKAGKPYLTPYLTPTIQLRRSLEIAIVVDHTSTSSSRRSYTG